MTTGIQIKFYDKEYGESVFYGTDSFATYTNRFGEIIRYSENIEKIIMNDYFILINAGIDLTQPRYITKQSEEIQESIVKSKRQTKKKMKNLSNIVMTELKNATDIDNTMAYTAVNGSKIESGLVDKNKLYPLIQCNVIGSGSEYAIEFLSTELGHYMDKETKRINASVQDIYKIAEGTLKYAAYKDGYTGGKLKVAIATKGKMLVGNENIPLNKI